MNGLRGNQVHGLGLQPPTPDNGQPNMGAKLAWPASPGADVRRDPWSSFASRMRVRHSTHVIRRLFAIVACQRSRSGLLRPELRINASTRSARGFEG